MIKNIKIGVFLAIAGCATNAAQKDIDASACKRSFSENTDSYVRCVNNMADIRSGVGIPYSEYSYIPKQEDLDAASRESRFVKGPLDWVKSIYVDSATDSEASTYLWSYRKDAYGYGVNADQYGRPFSWQTETGEIVEPWGRVTPDAYGPGVGMDQYGRPVIPVRK